ncbi:STAS domain-containing protein [Mesobacillus subterraneus]|uniref:STAS domain-containing protein n=1 Tax=Mesobacillus subterraneus TaxID=285983 RepID=UPI00204126B3|nr:STAS domain-containing protein [Mesobacillus subterraneus]MCM3666446.1 STAS domain-containing protein [Mesobacillus subterraneus]MCM3685445.1 STAS domain-containing protein [Mesobacillus subterraneus]
MGSNYNYDVEGINFSWDLKTGKFSFEGQDAVLFWISSAMKTFFDTIEEISGEEASNLVFESTGFRQGLVVGQYFEKMKEVSVAEAAEMITNTYASAGWGMTIIKDLDFESMTFTAFMKDSWEHKVNVAQGKTKGGSFLPAHYAGVFSGLFGTNIWYKITQHQLEGHDHSVIEYFPADVTISDNIHQLARKKESEHIRHLENLVDEKTAELKELVNKLSSPIIPVLEGIVVVPLIGKYEEDRADQLLVNTLDRLPSYKASYLVLDLTGMEQEIGPHAVSLIEKIGSAARLIGTKTILVGISSSLGIEITQSNINLSKFDCFQTLQHGIHYAIGQMGRKII